MKLISREIEFQGKKRGKRNVTFFSKTKYFRQHLKDHFFRGSEPWFDLFSSDIKNGIRYIRKISMNKSEILPDKNLTKVYSIFAELILSDIQWSVYFPIYIVSEESKEMKKGNASNLEKKINLHRSTMCFLSKKGYIVIVEDMAVQKQCKTDELVVRTAYFPVRINPGDSWYKCFNRAWKKTKKKYEEEIVINNKHNTKSKRGKVEFISEAHWKRFPSMHELKKS